MRGLERQMAERRADAEGGVLEPGDEQEEAEVEDLVLAVGTALDVAAQEQRDEVVTAGSRSALGDLPGQECVGESAAPRISPRLCHRRARR